MPKYFILPAVLIAAASLTTSCIDSDYDLSDIDLTLGVNGDLSLPLCSTSDIVLRSLMDLEEDGVVQFVKNPNGEDSIFVVRQTGKTDIDPIKIEAISFENPSLDPFSASINLKEMMGTNARRARKAASSKDNLSITVTIKGQEVTIPVTLEEKAYVYEITSDDATAFKMDDLHATGITSDLVELKNVKLEENTITADLNCDIYKFSPFIKNIHLDDSKLSFPVGLNVKSAQIVYTKAGKKETKNLTVDNANGVVTIFKGESPAMDVSQKIQIALKIDEATVGKNIVFQPGRNGSDGEMTIKGEFRMDGAFRMDMSEMNYDELQKKLDDQAESIINNPKLFDKDKMEMKALDLFEAGLLPGNINVEGGAKFGGDIKVRSVSGKVKRTVDNPDPIKLDDMPDFLNDDDVVLDLDNPAIFLTIQNQLPGVAETKLTMKATTDETVVRETEGLQITTGTNLFMLADKEATFRPEGYEEGVKWVKVEDLGGLIRRLPDQVDIEIAPVTLEADELSIPGTYDISLDYEIFSPLTCGPKFTLVYSDTERGWAEDMGDLEDVDAGYIQFEALAESNLPADITLTITPIDEEGKAMVSVKEVSVKIAANKKDQKVTFNLEPKEGYTMNDAFAGKNGSKQLDGVQYRAVIDNPDSNDATLRDSAKIRLYNIKTTLKGGITIDAN